MKVLFIGGTGKISSACAALAMERGVELYFLNRGQTSARPAPPGVHQLHADVRNPGAMAAALEGHTFDVVVNWIVYTVDQLEPDIELFRGRVGQYIFISSASAYQTPPVLLPATESTPLDNPHWLYSRNKIACEERLIQEYRQHKFPITLVRPSHTYDRTSLPI
ncbi:MAG TPA: NAD-dependent epimerase/dehydratase family protein, partial [Caldilineaceae bacterium]|nr:NAD-dependent epimerase/dehydratase family protein [Caldilineaceae bacterium]